MESKTDAGVILNEERKLSKSQKKRLKQYQSLGTTSKAKTDKQKFDAKYASLYQKSFSRRRKLKQMSMYEQFTEILSIRGSKTLNPSNFLDYLASLITVYVGQNQTVSISKFTSNKHINNQPLSITNIDMLIPYYAPRDKVSFKLPPKVKQQMKKAQQIEIAKQEEKKSNFIDWDENDNDNNNDNDNDEQDYKYPWVQQETGDNENKDDGKQEAEEDEIFNINASYAFGALPDQRLFTDNKSSPYVMDETFKWTILHGTSIMPPRLHGKRAGFEKIVGAAIISDGKDNTYCIYGTRDGLFYNKKDVEKPVKLIDKMVDGIFRQNDYLFVVCQGPILYNISLSTKNSQIIVTEQFKTKRKYSVYTVFNSFIGGYYMKGDEENGEDDKLILGTNNAQIYIFKSEGLLDSKFNDRYSKFRKKQLSVHFEDQKLEKGNVLYFDIDRNCVVYIGTKYVMTVNLTKSKGGGYSIFDDKFAKIYDIKWFLKGISYDCNYFHYIYHQKTLCVLKRVQSSAHCPYVLKVYTGKSLRFQ